MPMNPMVDIPYFGSLQSGSRITCENPLEEVWSRVSQFGHTDFLTKFKPEIDQAKWNEIVKYAVVRVRQSVEFHKAGRNSTLLTSPLPYYYSFLNLTRACLALKTLSIPGKEGHGLSYEPNPSGLLDWSAKLNNVGTFCNFLQLAAKTAAAGTTWSLDHSFARVIETVPDYEFLSQKPSRVVQVHVFAKISGEISLEFQLKNNEVDDFRNNWKKMYPELSVVCDLSPEGPTLTASVHSINQNQGRLERSTLGNWPQIREQFRGDKKKIVEFCAKYLEPKLIWDDNNLFFVYKNDDQSLLFREAYYYLGMFILGSTVRYEPQLLIDLAGPDSAWGWFVERFLISADRFFPQLMLSWLNQKNLFFS